MKICIQYDLFDLIGIDYNTKNFQEQQKIAKELYPNVDIKNDNLFSNYPVKVIDYSKYFENCHEDISETDYLLNRKIDLALIDKYQIGYDKKDEIVVFPINKNCYFGRGVKENIKLKSRGISYLFNEDLLKNNSNDLIYVTESIIDSLSLETIDSNIKTISLNGLNNYKRLLKVIEENNYKGNLVLAFDNDKAGLDYQKIVRDELLKLNVRSFSINLISNLTGIKDINEALISNRNDLEKNYNYFNDNFKKIIEKNKESELIL